MKINLKIRKQILNYYKWNDLFYEFCYLRRWIRDVLLLHKRKKRNFLGQINTFWFLLGGPLPMAVIYISAYFSAIELYCFVKPFKISVCLLKQHNPENIYCYSPVNNSPLCKHSCLNIQLLSCTKHTSLKIYT